MFICERMIDLREQMGHSSERFRRLVDIAPQKYLQIEAGGVTPNCREVSRIARALGVTTDYLLGMDLPIPSVVPDDDSPDDNFRIRFVRMLRKRYETVEDISKLTGKGITTVRRWETGQNIPSVRTLVVLAQHFGCTTDYLLGISM